MDARYTGALKAFLSHNPEEMPINPGAPDPLKNRGSERMPVSRYQLGAQPSASDLLPLILAQLPLQPTYRLRQPPRAQRGHAMTGR